MVLQSNFLSNCYIPNFTYTVSFFNLKKKKKSCLFQNIFGISKIEAVAGLIHITIGGPLEAILVLRNYISSPSELLRHRALKSEKSAILGRYTDAYA